MTDGGRRFYLLFPFHQDGLNITAFIANGNGNFIETYSGVAGTVFGEKGQNLFTVMDSICYRPAPILSNFNIAFIKPHIVSAFFQVFFYLQHQFFIAVVPVTEKNTEFFKLFFNVSARGTAPDLNPDKVHPYF
jgi:hypothetical protein